VSIEDRVNKVLVDGIGIEPAELCLTACLKDNLGIDSTEMVEVIVAMEKEFGVKVPDGVIGGGTTIKDLVSYFGRTVQ